MDHPPLKELQIDPLPQYGSHAFLSYLPKSSSDSRSSTSIFSSSSSTTKLPPFSLYNTSSWTYSGPVLDPSAASLPPSFHTWTEATISSPTDFLARLLPLLSFLDTFLRDAGAHNYWLTIRASKANHDYDMTRWHTDDIFFDYDGEKDRVGFEQNTEKGKARKNGYWKMATTLLGPSTLFLKDGERARQIQREAKQAECEKRGEHTCTQFRCLGCLDAVEAVRKTLASEFAHETVERPAFGEIAFFRLGNEEGAVHSEPACHEDRIFVNIVPGTEEELRALMKRWGLGFPRAWCFGVPVGFDDVACIEEKKHVGEVKETEFQREHNDVDDVDDDVYARRTLPVSAPLPPAHIPMTMTTMSMNLRDEYAEWLQKKGFRASKVFGSLGVS